MLQKMKVKTRRAKFLVEPKEIKSRSEVETERFNQISSKVLIDRLLEILYSIKGDCEKQYPIFLPKSTYESLQIALAFSFSKTLTKNTSKVKEAISILNQEEEALQQNHISIVINTLIDFIKQGRDNYEDTDEVLYLVSNLSPLLYQEKSNES